jgi:hypothetical protein
MIVKIGQKLATTNIRAWRRDTADDKSDDFARGRQHGTVSSSVGSILHKVIQEEHLWCLRP